MKKIFTILGALCLCASAANATTWGLVGEFNGWNAGNSVSMNELSENEYSITVGSLQGQFKFCADNSWSLNFGAASIANLTGNGAGIPMVENGANFVFEQEVKDVTLTINVVEKTLKVSGLATDMELPSIMTMYMIGDPAGEWAPSVGIQMELAGGKFVWSGMLYENNYLGFANKLAAAGDWEGLKAHRYAPEGGDGAVLSTTDTMKMAYPSDMGAWKVEKSGMYTLTLDPTALTLTAEFTEVNYDWGLIGSFNSWSDDVMFTKESDGIYTLVVDELDGDFKFRANRDWSYNLGAADEAFISGEGVVRLAENGANLTAANLKNVKFTLNTLDYTLTIDAMNGVEMMTMEETPIYFNLQGVRVVNPENGTYIRVANGKASKVMVK